MLRPLTGRRHGRAYIAAEQSVDLDHFHFAQDGILIRVEDNFTFSVSSGDDHEFTRHPGSLFRATVLLLLRHEKSTDAG